MTGKLAAGLRQKKAGPKGPAEKHRKLCQEETNNEQQENYKKLRVISVPAFAA
jgi:hypothetical protein